MTQDELKLVLEALETPSPMGQYKAITAIKEALAQPEQEPVAFWNFNSGFSHCMIDQLNEAAKKNPAPLYTTPPQRTWVGLTTEERNDCLVSADPCETLAEPEAEQLMEDIEAKLKQKNGYAEENT